MTQKFINNYSTTVAQTFGAGDTYLRVTSPTGLPVLGVGEYFLLTVFRKVGQNESGHEVVKVTEVVADQLMVERSIEGAAASTFNVGDRVEARLTAGSLDSFTDAAQAAEAAPVQSVAGKTGAVALEKADVGLTNVDNTSDLGKPISTATQTALDGKQPTGSYVLASDGRLTDARPPSGGAGGVLSGNYPNPGFAVDMATQVELDTHTADTVNPHGVTKAQVGLGNVDNTADSAKPVSTAQQTALNAKQATLVSGSNIKTVNGTSLLGSGNVDTGTANGLKSATTTVSVSSAAAPTAGQVLTATSPTAATWQAAAAGSSLAKTTRTSNTALGVADKGNLIFASASYTQTIISAASLGAGWWCLLRVDVGHETTLDPNGSELIDGQATAVLRPGQTYLLTCTGTAFTLDRLGFGGYTEVLTGGTSWTCPGGVRTIKVTCVGGGAVSAFLSVAPGAAYSYAVGAGGPGGAAGVTGTVGGATYWGASEFGGQGGYGGWVGGSLTSSLSDGGTGGGVIGASPFFARHGTAGTFGNASRNGTGGTAGIPGTGYASGMGGNGGALAGGGFNGSQGCVIIEY